MGQTLKSIQEVICVVGVPDRNCYSHVERSLKSAFVLGDDYESSDGVFFSLAAITTSQNGTVFCSDLLYKLSSKERKLMWCMYD